MARRPARKSQKPPQASGQKGQVRIIGGDWRGRKLPVLKAEGLRPTSDRVRETLFNWLQFDIAGARCLDVFAGSGALGFEAASRGAKQVVMLELSTANATSLKSNCQLLKADSIVVHQVDSLTWLSRTSEQAYDAIFLDPPFHKDFMQESLNLLFENGYIGDGTTIYLEQENDLNWPQLASGWVCKKEKKTSQVRFGLFIKEAE